MKLYPKQLNSVAELKKERRKLLQLRDETGQQGLGPLDTLFAAAGNKSKKKKNKAAAADEPSFDLLSVISSFLSPADMLQLAIDYGLPLLGKGARKIKTNFLEKAAKEFFGGYIRWKALSLAIKLAGRLLRTQGKNKKATS